MTASTRRLLASATLLLVLAAGCSTASDSTASDSTASGVDESAAASDDVPGIRLVSAQDGAEVQNDPPENLVILDVRTSEEFAEGHLEGAVMLDFYQDDFADQLAELDPNVPYLLYCRSGSRSGQTAAMMSELGFTDVADIDGGILAWTGAGLPTTNG